MGHSDSGAMNGDLHFYYVLHANVTTGYLPDGMGGSRIGAAGTVAV